MPDSEFCKRLSGQQFILGTLFGAIIAPPGEKCGMGFMDYTLANPLQIEVISRRSRSRAPEAT